jgi:hypothetical protein
MHTSNTQTHTQKIIFSFERADRRSVDNDACMYVCMYVWCEEGKEENRWVGTPPLHN